MLEILGSLEVLILLMGLGAREKKPPSPPCQKLLHFKCSSGLHVAELTGNRGKLDLNNKLARKGACIFCTYVLRVDLLLIISLAVSR